MPQAVASPARTHGRGADQESILGGEGLGGHPRQGKDSQHRPDVDLVQDVQRHVRRKGMGHLRNGLQLDGKGSKDGKGGG